MDDAYVRKNSGRIRADLHDRLTQPLYPIVFTLIAFLFLGEARTTRQSRGIGVAAVLMFCFAVRLIGFASVNLSVRTALGVPLVYLAPIAGGAIAAWFIYRERRPAPPAVLRRLGETIAELAAGLYRRFGAGVQPAGRG